MDKQIYDNYRQSRNITDVSAFDSYLMQRKSAIDNYEEAHKRLFENMKEARCVEKELAERVLKLLEKQFE